MDIITLCIVISIGCVGFFAYQSEQILKDNRRELEKLIEMGKKMNLEVDHELAQDYAPAQGSPEKTPYEKALEEVISEINQGTLR